MPPKLLANKDFIRIVISQVTSILSLTILNYVLLLRMYHLTNSTLAVSFLWLASSAPVIIVGPFAATVVDLFDRKKLLMFTNFFQALTLIMLIPAREHLFLIYLVVFIYSLLNQFYLPAESAIIPKIVPQERWLEANGFFFISKQASVLLGFGSAVLINKYIPNIYSALICSALLLIAFIAVSLLPNFKRTSTFSLDTTVSDFLKEVVSGYKYIKNNKAVLYPLMLIGGLEILLTIVMINLPSIAKTLVHININDAAMLIIFPAAFGALIGVYFLNKLIKKVIRKKVIIEISLIALSLVFFCLVVVLQLVPAGARYYVLPIISLFMGMSFLSIYMVAQTVLQQSTPEDMLGRIYGNMWFLITLATILPLTLSASITEITGVGSMLVILSFTILLCAIFSRKYGDKYLA